MFDFLPPKTLVIGAKGFIGSYFYNYYKSFFNDLIATHHTHDENMVPFSLDNPDLALISSLKGYSYALIAAGWTSPKKCEENPEKGHYYNVEAPLKISHALINQGITPILFSTDNVFDGLIGNYTEEAVCCPLNAYGRGKSELEARALKELKGKCLVIRLVKAYSLKWGEVALIDEMVKAFQQGLKITAAVDQRFAPICIDDLVKIVVSLQRKKARGLFNIAGEESLTRYDLARRVADKLFVSHDLIQKISISDIRDNVNRPKDTTLNTNKVMEKTAVDRISLEDGLKALVKNYSFGIRLDLKKLQNG